VARALKVLFVVSAACFSRNDVVNVCAWCPSPAPCFLHGVNRVTNLANHAERVTRNDEDPELAPVRAVSPLVTAARALVKLSLLRAPCFLLVFLAVRAAVNSEVFASCFVAGFLCSECQDQKN